MNYKPLIHQAIKRNGWTRYKLAQQLGYKRVSNIYDVEKGRTGLSAEKLYKLMQLAGTSLALLLVIGAALLFPAPADARENDDQDVTVLYIMRSIATWAMRQIEALFLCLAEE